MLRVRATRVWIDNLRRMPTLAELTLKLSRDLSTNHRECRDALDRLERDRSDALAALPQATDALKTWRKAVLEAEVDRDDALAKADLDHQRADRQARSDREAMLRTIEKDFRADDAASLKKRDDAEAKARAEYDAEIARISANKPLRLDLVQTQRRAAEQKLADAIRAIHAEFVKALDANKNAQADKFRAALTQEVLDWRIACDIANAKRQEAAQIFERALKAAETRLRSALAAVPAAAELQSQFDAARSRIKDECRAKEAALFATFREAKEQATA